MPRKNGNGNGANGRVNGRKRNGNGHPGQPTKYRPEMCEKVLREMRDGVSLAGVCRALGVSEKTLADYRKKYPEFTDAVETGITWSRAWWENQGRLALHDKTFQSTPWIMNMRNRFQWKGQDPVEHKGKLDVEHKGKLTVVISKEEEACA